MTVVVPPGFYEFIKWLTEESRRQERGQHLEPTEFFGTSDPAIARLLEKLVDSGIDRTGSKVKRKVSAYNRKYSAAFKKCKKKHMKKNGTWKKGGFKRCVKEAHRMAKK